MNKPINVDVSKLDTFLCPNCESPYCVEVFQIKQVPALMSPTGKEQVLKLPTGFACVECQASMFTEPKEETENAPTIELVK